MVFSSIETVLVILVLLSVGFFMSWKGWLLKEHKPLLTKLIINISVPAITIRNFFDSFSREIIFSSGKFLLMPLITMVICFVVGIILSNILKINKSRKGSFIAMCTVSNSIFIGLPVCLGLFGEKGIPYAIFYYMVNTVIFWSLCAPKIRIDGDDKAYSIIESIKKIFSVPLITVLICIALLLIGFKPPSLIMDTVKYLGNMSTPLSLIFIGGIIYEIGFENMKIELSIIVVMFMRFILAPIITFFVCKLAGLEEIATQVFTIQAAMPIMTQTVVVSEIYNADSQYAAKAASITTLASLFFIPIYMFLMPYLW